MSTGRARYWRWGLLTLGALLAVAGLGTLGVSAQTSATDEDPLAMFAELMPVFSSPRCVNCHGGTNPQTNFNHLGGQQDVPNDDLGDMSLETGRNAECLLCHTAEGTSGWRLAPKAMSFVGKDALPLCRQFRKGSALAFADPRANFHAHLQTDELIGVAFVGQGGIGEDSAFFGDITTEPPPMTRGEFIGLARRWLEDGEGACTNKWNGTITETTTAADSVTFAPAPGGRKVDTESKVTITVVEDVATADVQWRMRDFTDVPLRECPTSHLHLTSTANASGLPVSLQIVMQASPSPGPGAFPELPPGFALPPGVELPPEMTLPPGQTLPPGVPLPPGVSLPAGGKPFFMYSSTDKSEVGGNDHIDTISMPGCRQTITDTKHPYHITGALVEFETPPKFNFIGEEQDPNHIVGEKVIDMPGGKGKIVIKWDLIRDRE